MRVLVFYLFIFASAIYQLSLANHAWQARTEARERAVPLSVHLADVLSAGFGTLPFIGAIRKARLEFVSFAGLPLVDQDVNVSLGDFIIFF